MNIIICGAGRVGLSIATYLSLQNNNDITVIDSSPDLVKRISDTYDLKGIVGHASEPDVLKQAGAEDCDIIIAVTDCDEVNMVACQVAHSVFGISKKIARIRNKAYRDVAWSNLFSRDHMPIDVIISPEEEIAEAMLHRMSVPGTTNDMTLVDHKVHIFGLLVKGDLYDQTIHDMYYGNRDFQFRVVTLLREGKPLYFDDTTKLESGDEIYVLCRKNDVLDILDRLGNKNDIYSGRVVIAGGGVVGKAICENIENHSIFKKHGVVIIENDTQKCRNLARQLPGSIVLNGSSLDEEILKEADVAKSSVFVSVTNNNEGNILSAVLAKKIGAQYAIALSTNKLYNQLLPENLVDAIVNPDTITISRILHYLRKGHITSVNSIRDTGVEIIEARVTENCSIVNVPLEDVQLPKHVSIIGVFRHKNKVLQFPDSKTVISPYDTVLISAPNSKSDEVARLFYFSINLF